jgi:sigma-B regulation protein RsbU (phosphoserine phosphatase)
MLMRILVGWDDAAELDLIALYLNLAENHVAMTADAEEFLRHVKDERWDVVLMTVNMPDVEKGYEIFARIRELQPECPVVGACQQQDVYRIARFMTNGMRNYVLRDAGGDYMFYLYNTLENVVEAIRAEREQKLAERLREEIDSVRKLQESIIPRDIHCPEEYEIVARYEPSQIQVVGGRPVIMAGGDYYDVFSLDDKSIVLLVGDASGHGMKACMSIMTMHTLVRMIRGQQYQDTASFVAEVNNRLCQQSVIQDEGGFITLLYGVLRATDHVFQWSSAGHPAPLLHDLESDEIKPIAGNEAAGLPLGIYDDGDYTTLDFVVPRNSRLLLYTDGLQEAFPEGKEGYNEYGMEGIAETLRRCKSLSVQETMQALFDDSAAFTQGAGRHDDTSVVLLQRS